jgi:starvation-inducible DNA-binding protein
MRIDDATTLRRINDFLAHLWALQALQQDLHWRLQGPAFASVHGLLEEFYDATRGHMDSVGERLQALGAAPVARPADHADLSDYHPGEGPVPLMTAVRSAADATDAVAKAGYDAIDAAESDPITEDILIEVTRGLEHQLYLLGQIAV